MSLKNTVCGSKAEDHTENAGWDELRKRIADMSEVLRDQPTAITEYDHTQSGGCDALVRGLIEKVTVYTVTDVAADKFTLEFKFGVTVDVKS
jgi:site-specific DNA recombinase